METKSIVRDIFEELIIAHVAPSTKKKIHFLRNPSPLSSLQKFMDGPCKQFTFNPHLHTLLPMFKLVSFSHSHLESHKHSVPLMSSD
jgi:hypothetical protein